MQPHYVRWIIAGLCLAFTSFAQTVHTIDLKQFVGPSPIEATHAEWLVPRGQQVLDGVPFQMDGAILLYSTSWLQKSKPARTNVNDIPVGQRFELLHLLAAAQQGTEGKPLLAKVRLNYMDGSNAVIDIQYGEHVRSWFGPSHKKDPKLGAKNAHVAWQGQHTAAAKYDTHMRLFHVSFTNPSPDKEVRSLSLESAKGPIGLMIAAISVGPANAPRLADTQPGFKLRLPDTKPRSGELSRLQGVVKDNDGVALTNALVKVTGTRPLNTSEDRFTMQSAVVGRETKTSADGSFSMELPDNQLYRLMIIAERLEPMFYAGADPKADPIEIRIPPATNKATNFKFMVRATVLGPDNQPMPYAIIEREGVSYNGGTSWGSNEDMPEQVIADAQGQFALGRNRPFTRVQVKVHAPGLAIAHDWLDVTNSPETIKMDAGVTIRGRVVKDGKPLAKVEVGLTGSDRSSEVFAGHFSTETDTNGVFEFLHAQSNIGWYLHGKGNSLKKYGALPFKAITSGAAGTTNDIGDFQVTPGLHLAGQFKTAHGEPLPKGLKIGVGYDKGWDSQTVVADADGKFRVDGLTPEQIEVWFQNDNWMLTVANPSLTEWNFGQMSGQLEKSKDDLVIVIQPGKGNHNSYWNGNGHLPPEDEFRNKPFAGAEVGVVTLSGQVVDDATGQLIRKYRVVPGRKPPAPARAPQKSVLKTLVEPLVKKNPSRDELPFWYAETEEVTNGHFSVGFAWGFRSQPMLRIEADGYDPAETEPASVTTNLVVRLKHGFGPQGVIVLPDGSPAEKAYVVYGALQEQFMLHTNRIETYGDREKSRQITGKDGKFSFAPRSTGRKIFVAHALGWAQEEVGKSENMKIRLQPWASISGTLVKSNGVPVPGVELNIAMRHDWNTGEPFLNMYDFKATTDAKGRFTFAVAPPERLDLQRIVPSSRNSWSYVAQTWFDAKPGIKNDLGNVTYDTPPPPPVIDQWKQKLGF